MQERRLAYRALPARLHWHSRALPLGDCGVCWWRTQAGGRYRDSDAFRCDNCIDGTADRRADHRGDTSGTVGDGHRSTFGNSNCRRSPRGDQPGAIRRRSGRTETRGCDE